MKRAAWPALLGATFWVLGVAVGLAQYTPYSNQALANSGAQGGLVKVAAFAQVSVCAAQATGSPCSPTVPVYSAPTGGVLVQPIAADQNGNFSFYAPQGVYTISACLAGTCNNYQSTVGAGSDTGLQAYNVKAFGAKGDGVTNDLTSIQAAVTAACPGGGRIYFPPGTYFIGSSPISAACSGLQFFGSGIHASSILLAVANTEGILGQGVNNIVVRDLEINGNQTGSAGTGACLMFKGVNGLWIEDVYAHDGGSGNIAIDTAPNSYGGSQNVMIRDVVLGPTHNNAIGNIQLGNSNTSHVSIISPKITESDASQLDIDINYATDVQIVAPFISGGAAGIQIEASTNDTKDVLVEGGEITGTSTQGCVEVVSGAAGHTISGIRIQGVNCISGTRGFLVTSENGSASSVVKDITLSGNFCQNSTASCYYIWNQAGATTFTGITLVGNIADGCGPGDGAGCFVLSQSMTGVTLADNRVTASSSGVFGLFETGAVGSVTISGNDFSGAAGGWYSAISNLVGHIFASGAASGSCLTGSTYSNLTGSSGSTWYACIASAWSAKY